MAEQDGLMETVESTVSADTFDVGGDTAADPFDSFFTEVISRGDDTEDPAPPTETKESTPAKDADGEAEPEASADADAGSADKPGDGPTKQPDDVDPQESDLHKDGEKSWVEPHKWKAMLRLRDAAKTFLGDEPEDGKPLTVRAIREGLEALAPIAETVKSNGITTADDLKEALEAAEHRKASVADFQSDDPRDVHNFLDQWRQTDPNAFARMAASLPSYLEREQPEVLAYMVEQFPDRLQQLPEDARFRVTEKITRAITSDFERKAREFYHDRTLSEDDRYKAADFYIKAVQATEYELYKRHRTPEEILGQQIAPPDNEPDPRDEELNRVRQQQSEAARQQQDQYFAGLGQNLTADLNKKVADQVEALTKTYKDAKFEPLILKAVERDVMAGIVAKMESFKNDLALAKSGFRALRSARTQEELRSRYTTLVENHGKLVSKAVTAYKQSPEFAELRKQLVTQRKQEVQKREAAQNKAPVAASNSRPEQVTVDVRNASTLDQGIDALFSRIPTS